MNWKEIYEDAKQFASHAHQLQTYDGGPYTKHLEDVEGVLKRYGFKLDEDEKSSVLICSSWLHDLLEDQGWAASYNDLRKRFGLKIADCVYGVTDNTGKNRDERKNYERIRSHLYSTTLKLADRIANLENSIKGGHRMSDMYKKEFKKFELELLERAVEPICNRTMTMWNYLRIVINT